MLSLYVKRLCASLLALLACWGAPAGATGRLCAPAPANTSAEPPRPCRIALLLPIKSENLGPPSQALKAGFMAAFELEPEDFTVELIDSGEATQDVLDAYAAAAASFDLVVGPLAKSAVAAVAASPAKATPTIALSLPADVDLPPHMLAIGLSIEDEARQAAEWAAREQPKAVALVLTTGSAWQKRISAAFASQWKQQGLPVHQLELASSNGFLSDAALAHLKAKAEAEPTGLVFAALECEQVRQLRAVLGPNMPIYAVSTANPGSAPGTSLDGLRVLDLPWLLQSELEVVKQYARPERAAGDLERLYALGIDAYRVARAVVRSQDGIISLDGVTGRLEIEFGDGPARFDRVESAAIYQAGAFTKR